MITSNKINEDVMMNQNINKNDFMNHSKLIKKFLKMGKNSSTILLSLIEDILDLSKIEAGTFVINNSHFEISELLNEINDLFSYQCEQKKIVLRTL
jgi:signal transduction histidine kinase